MRLIDIPSALQPPHDVVERLQRLDPNVDLYYAGNGEWLLGRVKPNTPRRQAGLRQIAMLERMTAKYLRRTFIMRVPVSPWERWKERWLPWWLRWIAPVRMREIRIEGRGPLCEPAQVVNALLMMQGFGIIRSFQGPPDGAIVEWFRMSQWMMQNRPLQELERAVFDRMEGKAVQDVMRRVLTDRVSGHRSDVRRAMRRSVSERVTADLTLV